MRLTLFAILVWCVFGVAIHGWLTLVYPTAWLAVVGFFAFINYRHDKKKEAELKLVKNSVPDKSKKSVPIESKKPEPVLN